MFLWVIIFIVNGVDQSSVGLNPSDKKNVLVKKVILDDNT